jgi:hypothetical protein
MAIGGPRRYYSLKSGCCHGLNITLCDAHLAARINSGWKLGVDRGPDSQVCHDCPIQPQTNLPEATSPGT